MTVPLIYASYDYYDSSTRPTWVSNVANIFPDVALYDPLQGLEGQIEALETALSTRTRNADWGVHLATLGFPIDISTPWDFFKEKLPQIGAKAQQGYFNSLLLCNQYVLVRSTLVIVDADTVFQGSPSVDLLLASQLNIPTIMVCNRTVQPPVMLSYADVSISTAKLPGLVAATLKAVAVGEDDEAKE